MKAPIVEISALEKQILSKLIGKRARICTLGRIKRKMVYLTAYVSKENDNYYLNISYEIIDEMRLT